MITKNNQKYEVETHTHQIVDTATDDAGKVAYGTLTTEKIEISNDYHIPFHAVDYAVVKTSTEQIEVDDPTCRNDDEPTPPEPEPDEPRIEGADNTSVPQGIGIDLTDGVKAYDGDGNEISFTVEPTEIDKCDIGTHDVTYTYADKTIVRQVTITSISNPIISGIDEPITVEVGEEFDPLEGVTAKDGNGNDIAVEVE